MGETELEKALAEKQTEIDGLRDSMQKFWRWIETQIETATCPQYLTIMRAVRERFWESL